MAAKPSSLIFLLQPALGCMKFNNSQGSRVERLEHTHILEGKFNDSIPPPSLQGWIHLLFDEDFKRFWIKRAALVLELEDGSKFYWPLDWNRRRKKGLTLLNFLWKKTKLNEFFLWAGLMLNQGEREGPSSVVFSHLGLFFKTSATWRNQFSRFCWILETLLRIRSTTAVFSFHSFI